MCSVYLQLAANSRSFSCSITELCVSLKLFSEYIVVLVCELFTVRDFLQSAFPTGRTNELADLFTA